MSTRRMLAVKHASERFEAVRDLLASALDRHDSRSCLDAFVELCTLHLEQTGGTLQTAAYRAQLAQLRAVVQTRSHLSLVTPAKKETPAMDYAIETAAACLFCGEPGLVRLVASGEFEAKCSCCYDPTEDGHERSWCRGHGATPRAAVDAWLDDQDEHCDGVPYWPTNVAAQARAELARQAGWVETVSAEGIWFAPEILAQ
jgi:hypothetical protein